MKNTLNGLDRGHVLLLVPGVNSYMLNSAIEDYVVCLQKEAVFSTAKELFVLRKAIGY